VFEFGGATVQFAQVAGLGIVIGALVGSLFAAVNRLVKDPAVVFTLSLLSPYLAFALASAVAASGVLAVVVAGFLVAWRLHRVAPATRLELRAAWGQLTFLLNGLCFLYVGLRSPCLVQQAANGGQALWLAGLAVSGTVILTRVAWCFPMAYLPLFLLPKLRAREGGYPPLRGVAIASWCGVRGAISLAAALALPLETSAGLPFPGRQEIIACTLAVILATLLLQGATLLPLVKLLRIPDDDSSVQEVRTARERLLAAGIRQLDEFCSERECPVAVHRYRVAMADQLEALRADDAAVREQAEQRLQVSREVKQAVWAAQEAALLQLRDSGTINDLTYSALLVELDRGHVQAG
jgi:CPA1 family monovalent cation:H+ antiporter